MFDEFVHYSCVVFCMWFNIHTVVGKGLNLCIFDMFDHICSGLKKPKFLCTNVPRICSYFYVVFHPVIYRTYSGWKRSKFVYFLTCLTIPAVVWKCLNFYVQMFQDFVYFSCVVFSYVVYHTYSCWKRSKFVYFGHVLTISAVVWKSLNFYVQMFEEFVPY